MANCYACKAEIVFDNEHIGKNGKKIPLDPATHSPHDCPMREGKVKWDSGMMNTPLGKEEEKDDHGNENVNLDYLHANQNLADEAAKKFVDHTQQAKGLSKVKIFSSIGPDGVEIDYDKFLYNNQGKIKTQGAQFQMTRDEDNSVIFAIALYYEEVK